MTKEILTTAIVFRAIRIKSWIRDGEILPDAFFLRPAREGKAAEKTLSFLTTADCSREICFAGLNKCFGEFEIKVESIQELGLEIVDDSEDINILHHASIINLPPHEGNTLADAEFIAGELAKKVIRVKERPKS